MVFWTDFYTHIQNLHENRLQLEIGCKQGFQYTPRKII